MTTLTPARPAPARRTLTTRPTAQDIGFVAAARAAALSTLVIMSLIGIFLLIGAWPALHKEGWHFLTTQEWLPETGHFGVAALLWGTIVVGLFALCVAVPLGFGAALFISEYAPASLRKPLVTLVDLMAAVPSIVYAIWALFFLQAHLLTVAQWLSVHLGPCCPSCGSTRRTPRRRTPPRRSSPASRWASSCCRRSPRSCARSSRRHRSGSGKVPSPWARRAGG
jgi:phosphate transport system permease protein